MSEELRTAGVSEHYKNATVCYYCYTIPLTMDSMFIRLMCFSNSLFTPNKKFYMENLMCKSTGVTYWSGCILNVHFKAMVINLF